MSFKDLKNKRAITFVALIITIIVLLVLTGVSITITVGSNKIVSKVKTAKAYTEIEKLKEQVKIDISSKQIKNNGEGLSLTELKTVLDKYFDGVPDSAELKSDTIIIAKKEYGRYKIKLSDLYNGFFIENDGITAEDINKETDKSDFYGSIVKGYNCANSEGVKEWKIFYADNSNIYLIAGDYISKDFCPNSKTRKIYVKTDYILSMDYVISDYNKGTESITDSSPKYLNQLYFSQLEETFSSSKNNNMCAVAYMTDTSIWGGFAGEKAEYAIGGPTVEILIKSYIQKYNLDYQMQATSAALYQIRKNSRSEWGNGFYLEKSDSMYAISDQSKAKSLWVASPSSAGSSNVFKVRSSGKLENQSCYNTTNDVGFRPLVCLKSDVQLVKESEGVYTIK